MYQPPQMCTAAPESSTDAELAVLEQQQWLLHLQASCTSEHPPEEGNQEVHAVPQVLALV